MTRTRSVSYTHLDVYKRQLKYNTAIAAMMALLNDFTKKGSITKGEYKTLLILLNPVAPHITEELWQIIGGSGYVYELSLIHI